MSSKKKPWTVQWHIGADGTVIRQRSKGDQPHQQLYGSYTTNRRLGLAELDALDYRLARDKKVIGGFVGGLLVLTAAAFACFVVGVVLGWLGVDAARRVVMPAVIVLVVVMIAAGGGHGLMMSRWHRAWNEAGFESPSPVTMSAREAREIVGAPGAVSGRRTKVERA
ncbi:PrgI family protein [Kribbella sindirgiensis]|uniref:PrgI family protein n=1 Tax=Kribbella sindirgiensis TaxID=1124744 RepID=A0A4R0J184_9ACTN|nr:PrgI family protein [Kribbella sindirgiensis]